MKKEDILIIHTCKNMFPGKHFINVFEMDVSAVKWKQDGVGGK